MQSTAIYVKTEEQTKTQAQKVAKDLGLSLSAIINGYLKQLIRTKTITFTIDTETPNANFKRALKQSEDDYSSGKIIAFDSKEKVHSYLTSLTKNAKRK